MGNTFLSKIPIVIAFLLLAAGFASGAWWYAWHTSPSPEEALIATPAPALPKVPAHDVPMDTGNVEHRLSVEISAIRKALEEEIIARRHLEQALARLEKNKPSTMEKTYTTVPENEPQLKTPPRNDSQISFESALVAIGVDATRVGRIRHRLEQMELQQIYLRNQAEREGWLAAPRYAEERRKLEDREGAIRLELGDEVYDKYLFFSGEENRVSVQSVISGSAAQAAGITAGDVVYRYDQYRIFSWNDLNRATASGRSGETVPVEIHRNGQRLTVYMPRGPLGIRIAPQLEQPQP